MHRMVIGGLIGAGLVILATSAFTTPETVFAHHGSAPEASKDVIALTTQLADGREQLTLIDTRQRVVGVYHIDQATGEMALRSVRNISWDLQMTQFNVVSPLPQEIRSLLQQN